MTFGVRPNSPLHQTMVLSSSPRWTGRPSKVAIPLSISGSFRRIDLEILLVRVPALVVDRDVGNAVLDQPPRHQARLPERVAAIAVAQFLLFLREVEQFAFVAEDQLVGLLLATRGGHHRGVAAEGMLVGVQLASKSRRSRCCWSVTPGATTPSTTNRALRRVAAGGERFVARAGRNPASENRPCGWSARCRAESAR